MAIVFLASCNLVVVLVLGFSLVDEDDRYDERLRRTEVLMDRRELS